MKEVTEEELVGMLVENSDEPYAEEIAARVMKWFRDGKEIATTTQMKEVITEALCRVPKADREEAIKTAILTAKEGSIILVAGKGHEDYQIINGVKHHFDDKEKIKEAFQMLKESKN